MNFGSGPTNDVSTGLISATPMNDAKGRGDSTVINTASNIEAQFQNIQSEMKTLADMHKQRVKANFSDNKSQDTAIEAKTRSISTQITQLRDQIREGSNHVNSTQAQIQENMKMGFVARLRDLTTRFRDMQAAYITNIRRMNEKAHAAVLDLGDANDDEIGLDDFDPGLTGEQTSQIVANDLMLRQRNQELTQMIQSMNQLNELFADLGTLIIQQGTMLDRIDNTIVEAHEQIQQGNKTLEKAETHQKSKCFYWYMIAVILLIIIFGTVVIIKNQKKSSK
uniref:Syntaxin 16/TLG2-like protein n=1 Tax=Trichomonas vaginalis TaxID=5722 RepID=Q6EEV1_TRIVA|nr:syntaxin 16/TLG2-like protein [Trichomonas vaginalis]